MNEPPYLDNPTDEVAVLKQDSQAGPTSSNVKSFAKNSIVLSGAGIVISLLGFVYRIYIARYLGDTGYGTYVFVTTFVSYFSVVSLFGFRNVIVRQVAAARDQLAGYVTAGLQLRLISGSAGVVMVVVASVLLRRAENIRLALIVCGVSLLTAAVSDILDATLLGLERSEYSALASMVSNVVKLIAGVLLLMMGYGVLAILAVFTVTSLLNVVLNWYFLRRKLHLRLTADRQRLVELRRYVFRESLPFVYITLLSKVYYKNDILVLGWFKGDRVVGWYGGAYLAIDFLILVGGAVASAIFPIVSRMYATKSGSLQSSFERVCKYVFVGFAPVCVSVGLVGATFLPRLLSSRFSNGVDALRVLVWMVLFETLTLVAATVLAATGNQNISAGIALFGAVFNLGLNLAMVPSMSYMGAAWGTTISAAVNFGVTSLVMKRVLPTSNLLGVMWRPALVAGAMAAAILAIRPASDLLALLAGIVVYGCAIMALGIVDAEDKRILAPLLSSFTRRLR